MDGDPCAGLPAGEPFVVATSPRPGSVVSPPIEVSGCSRTFESTVIWRLTRRDGGVAAEGTTSGGGVDGPGAFRFTIESLDASPGLLHLDVSEPVVTEEEGHPPSRTVIPLVLEAPG
ncbi:MAG TPA: Gmad2 immunoglobulin-like domain-containing protein [Thermoanaerobaculia bacterium]|nr:Gmad2 immunoglobulin-like domain-containing protein [Thermoanaerobaculia bacterium]